MNKKLIIVFAVCAAVVVCMGLSLNFCTNRRIDKRIDNKIEKLDNTSDLTRD